MIRAELCVNCSYVCHRRGQVHALTLCSCSGADRLPKATRVPSGRVTDFIMPLVIGIYAAMSCHVCGVQLQPMYLCAPTAKLSGTPPLLWQLDDPCCHAAWRAVRAPVYYLDLAPPCRVARYHNVVLP